MNRGGARGFGRGGGKLDRYPPFCDATYFLHSSWRWPRWLPAARCRSTGHCTRYFPTSVRLCPAHPPSAEIGSFIHAVEDEMFCASLVLDKVPYFNAPIYLPNKSVIGKVDEILGPINEVYFSVKMGEGMVATSFKKGDKVYIGSDKLLPIERFLPKPKATGRNPSPSNRTNN
ncbi:Gar1/Naf1 RNA binding region-domain-containing protein [Lanmaoa asiatica]|nr:Gar1/Naf1 RNA binding region-domain-containing protein [Lanmaoa asiatica]